VERTGDQGEILLQTHRCRREVEVPERLHRCRRGAGGRSPEAFRQPLSQPIFLILRKSETLHPEAGFCQQGLLRLRRMATKAGITPGQALPGAQLRQEGMARAPDGLDALLQQGLLNLCVEARNLTPG